MKAQDVALTEAGALMVAALPRLRRYARALVGDHAAADDLVQDALERAWARIDSWRPDGDMRAWLFSILHNLHVDQRRRPAVVAVPLDEEALASPVRASQTDGLEMRDLEIALRQLPPEQREVLLLVALEVSALDQARTLADSAVQQRSVHAGFKVAHAGSPRLDALPSGFALRGLKPLQTHPRRPRPAPAAATPFLAGENASTGFLGPLPGLR